MSTLSNIIWEPLKFLEVTYIIWIICLKVVALSVLVYLCFFYLLRTLFWKEIITLFCRSHLNLNTVWFSFFRNQIIIICFYCYFILLIIFFVLPKWYSDTNRWQTRLIMWNRVTTLSILQRVYKRNQGNACWLLLYCSCSLPSL
jgi:hypothetical protein